MDMRNKTASGMFVFEISPCKQFYAEFPIPTVVNKSERIENANFFKKIRYQKYSAAK